MNRLLRTIWFATKSAAVSALGIVVLTGVTCFRHGDIGPYPELDYAWLVPVVAMLVVYTFGDN